LVQAMEMSGISKSQVSRLCAEIDDKVKAFLARPIEGDWPYLWIDATHVKVRQNGRIAVIVAVGSTALAGARFFQVIRVGGTRGRNALSVYEDVRRVVLRLDASQAIEIWSPIRRRPVRQVQVAIVQVACARDMGTHRHDMFLSRCGVSAALVQLE
jgi:Transposase, Mutator family